MAKCSICKSRKGKRKCSAWGDFVCAVCCGKSRNPDRCLGCSYYKDDLHSRNYRKVPFYGIQQMADSIELQDISSVVESILCEIDTETESKLSDITAMRILELAFDKYHFKDTQLVFRSSRLKMYLERMIQVIDKELSNTSEEKVVKVMAAIYRSIQRRTNGGREYLAFAQQFVGSRVDSWPGSLQF